MAERRLAFVPNDPLVAKQWYLFQNRSYEAWPEPPPLAPVRVAVIDSGIDGTHPELATRIAAAQSFVGGSPRTDTQGHGTFVAGRVAPARTTASASPVSHPPRISSSPRSSPRPGRFPSRPR
jgi:hypothetical protein